MVAWNGPRRTTTRAGDRVNDMEKTLHLEEIKLGDVLDTHSLQNFLFRDSGVITALDLGFWNVQVKSLDQSFKGKLEECWKDRFNKGYLFSANVFVACPVQYAALETPRNEHTSSKMVCYQRFRIPEGMFPHLVHPRILEVINMLNATIKEKKLPEANRLTMTDAVHQLRHQLQKAHPDSARPDFDEHLYATDKENGNSLDYLAEWRTGGIFAKKLAEHRLQEGESFDRFDVLKKEYDSTTKPQG
jgi:hypothetical protein